MMVIEKSILKLKISMQVSWQLPIYHIQITVDPQTATIYFTYFRYSYGTCFESQTRVTLELKKGEHPIMVEGGKAKMMKRNFNWEGKRLFVEWKHGRGERRK